MFFQIGFVVTTLNIFLLKPSTIELILLFNAYFRLRFGLVNVINCVVLEEFLALTANLNLSVRVENKKL